MKTLRRDLTQGSESQHLLQMAIPMGWGMLAIMAMHLVDTYFVGKLGPDHLAAISFTFPVVTVMSSLAFGIGAGASSAIARSIGGNHYREVTRYSTQSVVIAVCLAATFALVGLQSTEWIFSLLGAPAELMPLIHEYMDTWYWGCVLVVVPMVGNAGIRAAGNTKLPSLVMITVAVVNILLDPLLIFGGFGVPAMGLQGAALATVIAYSIAFSVALYVLVFKLRFITWLGFCERVGDSWRVILRIGIPAASTNLIAPMSVAITTWLVAKHGSDAVAGFGVASRIESLCLVALMALASVMGPFSGQNWGAGKRERLARGLFLGYRFAVVWGLSIALILWLFADFIVASFSSATNVQDNALAYLAIVPLTYGFLGMVMVTNSVANGVGNPLPALVMTMMRLFILYLPLVWVLSRFLHDVSGIYTATALANILVGCGAVRWSRRLSVMKS